jgi:hypothetical protein
MIPFARELLVKSMAATKNAATFFRPCHLFFATTKKGDKDSNA